MPLPKLFTSIQVEETISEAKKQKGISLRDLLDELNRCSTIIDNSNDAEYLLNRENSDYHSVTNEDKIAQDKLKKMRGALNKLAPDNFFIHLLEIQELLPFDNYYIMNIFIEQFIEKAINEELFSPLYAHLCYALKDIELLVEKQEEIDDIANVECKTNFGSLILEECNARFSYSFNNLNWFKAVEPDENEKKELLIKEREKKRLLIGTIRFLGDLFKCGMIEFEQIFIYIRKLENGRNEKCLESLCKLISVAGKQLEAAVLHSHYEGEWYRMWQNILKMSKDKALCLRMRLLMVNLLELSNNNWQSTFHQVAPKTTIEILLEEQELNVQNQGQTQQSESINRMSRIGQEIITNEPLVVETEKQIYNLLKNSDQPDVDITKWELENFKGRKNWLIYSLARAVLRISIDGNQINRLKFFKYVSLLKRYIVSRQAEVSCMFAVQYIVIVEMGNPKGILEEICELLHANNIISYIAFLDWRENWSKTPILEIKGKAEAQITLANFFIKLFWQSVKKPAGYSYQSIVKELNSFDLEHFVSMSKLPPEIEKRIKMEEEREKTNLSQT